MTNWTARAKAYFSETGHPPTDKTDKTPLSSVSSVPTPGISRNEGVVSSVLSVPPQALSEKRDGVSSVSSVGVVALFENRVLAAELMAAAMRVCDAHGDGPKVREEMRQDVLNMPANLRADLLVHFRQTSPDFGA